MRAVEAETPRHNTRLVLQEHLWLTGSYTLSQEFGPLGGRQDVDHDVDLALSDRDTDIPLCCIQVRDGEIEFKQAMTRLFAESILIGNTNKFKTYVTAMTNLKTWTFQRLSLSQIFAPERVTLKLEFDANGNVDPTSLRRLMEALHGLLLIVREIPAQRSS